MNNDILLSIACLTFNHEKYISTALDSFLMQKTSFKFEIVVGDGGSTDKNRSIIQEYDKKYPGKFVLLFPEKDPGIIGILNQVYKNCKGKYIAICEGDDYWTDVNKLQKQIDFLEEHPDFAICHHNIEILFEKQKKVSRKFVPQKEITTLDDLADQNHIYTPTCVFRNHNYYFPDWYQNSMADYPLHMMNARHGKIKYFKESMAVYRINFTGAWTGQSLAKNFMNTIKALEFTCTLDFEPRIKDKLRSSIDYLHLSIIDSYIKNKEFEEANNYITMLLQKNPEKLTKFIIESRKAILNSRFIIIYKIKRKISDFLKYNYFTRLYKYKNWVRYIT